MTAGSAVFSFFGLLCLRLCRFLAALVLGILRDSLASFPRDRWPLSIEGGRIHA